MGRGQYAIMVYIEAVVPHLVVTQFFFVAASHLVVLHTN